MANVAAATVAAAAAAAAANRDPAVDRSLRSVFVGNIPYEATEEQLKDIFSEVGLVVSFRLVYDRETGKPKGYGFCEYQDQETALSAMRNLNGREFSGRALRVDNAASEKNKEELKSLGTGTPIIESPFGDSVSPEEAPESISRAVASLPPEQMFELMKQMKLCVQNSPQEARNMLLQNPQLAYALLQAQVVMRIVDPEIALVRIIPLSLYQPVMHVNGAPQMMQPSNMGVPNMPGPGPAPGPGPIGPPGNRYSFLILLTRGHSKDCIASMWSRPGGIPPRGLLGDGPNDPRGGTLLSVTGEVIDPKFEFQHHILLKLVTCFPSGRDPRAMDARGPVAGQRVPMVPGMQGPVPHAMGPNVPPPARPVTGRSLKCAALIMQVLQLTPEQIAMLPPEQRQSILILKEQIQKTASGAP
uniref:Cleavage stimulation factor, 3' pre-RNA, subunit 2 n=1 Tax=Xiphophorus couchianus TaxID=32473 RepID=A0A3B5MEE8_9TELE